MNDIEVSSIDLVEGGNVFKQGHYLTLGYVPRDENGETVDLSGKTLNVALWGRKGVVFEAAATFSGGVIRFTLDKTVPAAEDYTVEFTATSSTDAKYRKKFPANSNAARIAIKQSADDLGVIGISVYTIEKFEKKQKEIQDAYQSTVDSKVLELETEFDAAVSAVTVDSEVVIARGNEPTLNQRLQRDAAVIDTRLNETTQQLAETAEKISHIINVADFGAVGDGTNETVKIQAAIDYVAGIGGGTVQFGNKTYRAEGIVPKPNLTLRGTTGTTIKLVDNPTTHLIHYNDTVTLNYFNLYDLNLHGNNQVLYDVVHINEPNPLAPKKTWYMSVVDNCIISRGKVGIYCPVPGSVKINNSNIEYNDIGIKQLQEHFYVNHSVIWGNRVGADLYRANHFTWIKATIAHSTEIGIQAAEDEWYCVESAFIGCDFIDNGSYALKGRYERCRFLGCRFLTLTNGIDELVSGCTVTGNYFNAIPGTAIKSGVSNTITANSFYYCGIVVHTREYGSGVISSNILRNNVAGFLIDGDDVDITGNQIMETNKYAIKIDGAPTRGGVGINITGNTISNASKDGVGLYSSIEVHRRLNYGLISSNVIRELTARAAYGVWISPTAASIDTLVIGNVTRSLATGGFHLRTATNQSSNIGTVTAV